MLTTLHFVDFSKSSHDGLWVGESAIQVKGPGVGSRVVDNGRMGVHDYCLAASHVHTPVPHSLR